MGAVYEVIHTETERARALKIMLPELLLDEEMRGRFRLEARVTARINSEYIVEVLDAGIDDATKSPFLVMELLEGEELEKRLARVRRFEPQDVVTYLSQAAFGLDKTHKASIVHRDLKPANLMLTEREDGSPRIKILDFGIAKLIAEGTTAALATQALGTPLYMAPEQIRLDQKLSPAVDIFALGLIAYTLLVGVPYWADEMAAASNVYGLIGAVMQGPREPATTRAARRGVMLPPAFDAWFAKITAVDPSQRFPSASMAIAALAEVLNVAVAQRVSAPPAISAPSVSAFAERPSTPLPAADQDGRGRAPAGYASTSGSIPTVPMGLTPQGQGRDPSALPFVPAASAISTNSAVTSPSRPAKKTPAMLFAAIGAAVVCISIALVVVFMREPKDAQQGANSASQGAGPVLSASAEATPPVGTPSPETGAVSSGAPAPTEHAISASATSASASPAPTSSAASTASPAPTSSAASTASPSAGRVRAPVVKPTGTGSKTPIKHD